MKDTKYPNGYYPKLEYWQLQLSIGINKKDIALVIKATEKISYFANKQLHIN